MPKPPGDLGYYDKVNFVIDAWVVPCEAPWYIYIETLKPALLKAFITLSTFGWDDVARGYARPKQPGTRRTGKRKGKWRRAVPSWPETGEEAGKRLPGSEEVKGRKWGTATRFLWRIDSIAQRFLFFWLIADIAVDLVFDWTSLLYETVWCQESASGRFSYHSDIMQLIPGGVPLACRYQIRDYQFAPPFWTEAWGQSGAGGCSAFGTCEFEPRVGFAAPTEYTVNIANLLTGEVYGASGPEPADPDGKLSLVVRGNIPPFTQFVVNAKHDAAWALYGKGVVFGIEEDF